MVGSPGIVGEVMALIVITDIMKVVAFIVKVFGIDEETMVIGTERFNIS
jgi:hypothetical protein